MARNSPTDGLAPLIDRIGRGDRSSFTQLYEETSPRVRFFLMRMLGNNAVVDDVLVETYTAILAGGFAVFRKIKGSDLDVRHSPEPGA